MTGVQVSGRVLLDLTAPDPQRQAMEAATVASIPDGVTVEIRVAGWVQDQTVRTLIDFGSRLRYEVTGTCSVDVGRWVRALRDEPLSDWVTGQDDIEAQQTLARDLAAYRRLPCPRSRS